MKRFVAGLVLIIAGFVVAINTEHSWLAIILGFAGSVMVNPGWGFWRKGDQQK